MPKTASFVPVRVKYPEKYFDSKRIQMMTINAERKVGNKMLDDLRSTVEYWKHRADFIYKMHFRGGDLYLEFYLTGSSKGNQLWKYINEGTSAMSVKFNPTYEAKTQFPGSFHSNWTGVDTTPAKKIAYRYLVPVPPGIRARQWSTLLRQNYINEFALETANAIKRGLQPK